MGKHTSNNQARKGPAPESPSEKTAGPLRAVTILGVGILIVMAWMILNETRQQRAALEERLTLLQGQVSTLADKVDAAARARVQPARPSGPDPNKVYAVKTEGAPVEGPRNAPVTIAEFSDFQ